jgi:hypothetical protein
MPAIAGTMAAGKPAGKVAGHRGIRGQPRECGRRARAHDTRRTVRFWSAAGFARPDGYRSSPGMLHSRRAGQRAGELTEYAGMPHEYLRSRGICCGAGEALAE